jgi:beta-glucuronidase
MHRTFDTTTRRKQTWLDGEWRFCPDPGDQGMAQEWYHHFPARTVPVHVPGVWNTAPGLLNYQGVGWYARRFSVGACSAIVLRFGAVTQQANVWLDGEPLGQHCGGFLPFEFVVPAAEPGEHLLVVRVDSTLDMTGTLPSAHLDWFPYGGITRSVVVEEIAGPAYIANLRLAPHYAGETATLRVRAEVVNVSDTLMQDSWHLCVDGQPMRTGEVRLSGHESQVLLFSVRVPEVQTWTPATPRLYTARLELADDDLMERTGFCHIAATGNRVLLNGEPLQVRGVNRHEDHPDWGHSLPLGLMMRDLDLIQHLGANAVRGTHYPNDPRMLDLCDERGILFMEEIPLWQFGQQQLALDSVADRAAAMLYRMVERDLNHPCIWAWSVLNECATDTEEGRAVVTRLVDTVREVDDTRLVTLATDRGARDRCFDLVDVVCLNAYPGWYTHDVTWPQFLERMRALIGDKPLIVSEFGAGAIYGCHALQEGVVWSEEHQRKLLMDALDAFEAQGDLVGYYVWQFCDTRSDPKRALSRPRGYNNKGLVNEFRQPKLAYEAVRARHRAQEH